MAGYLTKKRRPRSGCGKKTKRRRLSPQQLRHSVAYRLGGFDSVLMRPWGQWDRYPTAVEVRLGKHEFGYDIPKNNHFDAEWLRTFVDLVLGDMRDRIRNA